MDKTDAATHRDGIAWRDVPGGAFEYNTGGSSGEPLIFYFGRWRQASDAAGRMRARRWWGVEPGEREVYLWGAEELNTFIDVGETFTLKLTALSCHSSQVSQYAEFLDQRIEERASDVGQSQGVPLAEAFRRVEIIY